MDVTQELNPKFAILNEVITQMGGSVERLIPERNCFRVHVRGKTFLMEPHISIGRSPCSSAFTTRFKEMSYRLLRENQLPTPKTKCFYAETFSKETALEKLRDLKFPIIVKDANGSNSAGLFLHLPDPVRAQRVIRRELPKFQSMIAQEMVFGKEYRVLVLDKKVIGAVEMVHPHVTGDGASSIRKLIRRKQDTTKKRSQLSGALKRTLQKQGVSLRSVPAEGEVIYFKAHSSLAEGGRTRDVTELVNPGVARICVEACKVVDKYLVGIDVICADIAKKPTKKNFHILEINGKPDFYIHYKPTYGKSRNVLKLIVNFLLAQKGE